MVNYVKENGDDDGPSSLTRSEITQLRHILEKVEGGADVHIFTSSEIAAIKDWIAVRQKFGLAIDSLIAREEAGRLWIQVRKRI